MSQFDLEEDGDPIQFHEALGEHDLSDDIRRAVVLASIIYFKVEVDLDMMAEEEFAEKDKALAKAIMFHGPFQKFDDALEQSYRIKGVVVVPVFQWTDDTQVFWVASLSN